jgi:F-type H+-transporting ATPase subunit a
MLLGLLGLTMMAGAMPAYGRWPIALGVEGFLLFIFCLELLVALIQAYVFVFLTAVFMGQTMHAAH